MISYIPNTFMEQKAQITILLVKFSKKNWHFWGEVGVCGCMQAFIVLHIFYIAIEITQQV